MSHKRAIRVVFDGPKILGAQGDVEIANAKKAAGRIADLGEPMRRLSKKYL